MASEDHRWRLPARDAHDCRLAERARAKGGTDRTKYGSSRASTRSFYVHHMQQVSKAAVVHDARATRVQICSGPSLTHAIRGNCSQGPSEEGLLNPGPTH